MIFTTLNFERTNIVLGHLFSEAQGDSFAAIVNRSEEVEKVTLKIEKSVSAGVGSVGTLGADAADVEIEKSRGGVASIGAEEKEKVTRPSIVSLTPVEVAVQEPILLPTRYASRDTLLLDERQDTERGRKRQTDR